MIRVVAPSRLHFGLLNVPCGDIDAGRRFGGCGLMIDAPGVAVRVERSELWSHEGPSGARALKFAQQVTDDPQRVVVESCPPEHVGLGVGTSLGLAVARAIHPELSSIELAQRIGRGDRSGIGIHGFDRGGFIVDGGKRDAEIPLLVGRYEFPPDWRVAIFIPQSTSPWHGQRERDAFARLRGDRAFERMEPLLTREIVPALSKCEFERFCRAIHEYNRLAGLPFAEEQGGIYAGTATTAIVDAILGLGFPGAGQSSWGPTVFAITEDPDQAEYLAATIRGRFSGLRSADVVKASTTGAVVMQQNSMHDDASQSDDEHIRGEHE